MAFFQKIIAFFMSIIAFFAGLFSGGKTPEQPSPEPSNPTAYTYYDYSYGSEARQTLDLVLPENKSGQTGLVLYIHGGAWIQGNKDGYRDALTYAASLGYAAGAINYRYLSDTVHMDSLMADVAAALGKMKELAAGQGMQLNKVLLTGSSAGAHMSLLYAYRYADTSPVRPAAVVSFCGPTDLTDPVFIEQNQLGDIGGMIGLMNRLCGVTISIDDYRNHTGEYDRWVEALRAYSPLNFVNAQTVPTVLGHGRKDTIVPFSNAEALNAALETNGVTHVFVEFPNSGHGLDKDADATSRMYTLLSQYAQTYLG